MSHISRADILSSQLIIQTSLDRLSCGSVGFLTLGVTCLLLSEFPGTKGHRLVVNHFSALHQRVPPKR